LNLKKQFNRKGRKERDGQQGVTSFGVFTLRVMDEIQVTDRISLRFFAIFADKCVF